MTTVVNVNVNVNVVIVVNDFNLWPELSLKPLLLLQHEESEHLLRTLDQWPLLLLLLMASLQESSPDEQDSLKRVLLLPDGRKLCPE